MNGTMISPSPIFKLFRAFLHDVAEAIEDGMERNRGLDMATMTDAVPLLLVLLLVVQSTMAVLSWRSSRRARAPSIAQVLEAQTEQNRELCDPRNAPALLAYLDSEIAVLFALRPKPGRMICS
jgi:predicted GTPase